MKIVIDDVRYTISGVVTEVKMTCHIDVERDWLLQQSFSQDKLTVTTCGTARCEAQDKYDENKGKAIARTKAYFKACRKLRNIIGFKIVELADRVEHLGDNVLEDILKRMSKAATDYAKISGIDVIDIVGPYANENSMWNEMWGK